MDRYGSRAGFTMVEMLTTVTILGILAVVTVNLFFSSLVGSGKGRSVTDIKQNGEFAITQIENDLRGARRLVVNQAGQVCATGMASVAYEMVDGTVNEVAVAGQRLAVNGSNFLTADNLRVENLVVNCTRDSGSNVALVEVAFDLVRGGQPGDKAEEGFAATFRTSVTMRNR
jgi:prepilin-type N-terminal cleavage/methylation domain-containing protein